MSYGNQARRTKHQALRTFYKTMPPYLLLITYCLLIVAASLGGGYLPLLVRLTHTRMQLMMSFVAGLMLGVGLFHMLPHAAKELESLDRAVVWLMAGLLTMFFLVRAFHFHEHGVVEDEAEHLHDHNHAHEHGHHHDDQAHHDHAHYDHGHHEHGHSHSAALGKAPLSWIGVAVGLSLHTALDGMALAANVAADARHNPSATFLAVGTFLAIMLHKPLDALSITALMSASNWPMNVRQAVNAGFALMCPIGAMVFSFGLQQFGGDRPMVIGAALAFSAGVFICISLGDLLPELQFHTHDRIKLSTALLAGIALAYLLGFVEPGHSHQHGQLAPTVLSAPLKL